LVDEREDDGLSSLVARGPKKREVQRIGLLKAETAPLELKNQGERGIFACEEEADEELLTWCAGLARGALAMHQEPKHNRTIYILAVHFGAKDGSQRLELFVALQPSGLVALLSVVGVSGGAR
jgi:hypothetical protein